MQELKILIADDNEDWVESLSPLLRNLCAEKEYKLNFEIELRGLRTPAHAQEFKPDIIILDSFFESSDYSSGEEVFRLLRNRRETSKTFIIQVDSNKRKVTNADDTFQSDRSSLKKRSVNVDRFNLISFIESLLLARAFR